ncbi:hypothetical protein KIN20_018587, partial [Parelaphostrongylus tenuis]
MDFKISIRLKCTWILRKNSSSGISTVRQSPLMSGRRSFTDHNGTSSNPTATTNRDQSSYQRSGIKLTSFNANEKGDVYCSIPSQWATQKAPPGQPSQLLWNANK